MRRMILDRAMGLLGNLQLDSKAGQKVESLSGGEQQRTAFARALINDPSVIVADEPTAHLDTELSEALLGIISRLKEEGKTFLIASHDPLVYQSSIVDTVITMRDGRVVSTPEHSIIPTFRSLDS
jgi:putative ABC transport system ATP-binding protein